jgi:hypothetical protein
LVLKGTEDRVMGESVLYLEVSEIIFLPLYKRGGQHKNNKEKKTVPHKWTIWAKDTE